MAPVDLHGFAAGDARLAHPARDDGRVRRRAAFLREDAFGSDHPVHVVGIGLGANQDRLASLLFPQDGVLGRKNDLSGRGSRRRVEALAGDLNALIGIDPRVKELIERLRVHHPDGATLVDQALRDEIAGDPDRGLGAALRVTRLQHEELATLDGKLEVLHVAIVALEPFGDLFELREDLRLTAREVGNLLGRSNPGDDVFALRIAEVLAEEHAFAGVRIASEGNARSRIVAHVPEDHLHHVDGRAPIVGNLVVPAVVDGALGVPGIEDGLDRGDELCVDVLRKVFAVLAHDRLEAGNESLPGCGVELGVVAHVRRGPRLPDQLFEVVLRNAEDDVGEHHDEAPVGVPGEALVVGEPRQAFDGLVVEPEVENRVHHPGHRDARAAAHGDEQRIVDRAELLAGSFLQLGHRRVDFGLQTRRKAAARIVEAQTGFGRDREARRNGQAGCGHLGEPGALPAEHVALGVWIGLRRQPAPFVEEIDELAHRRRSRR